MEAGNTSRYSNRKLYSRRSKILQEGSASVNYKLVGLVFGGDIMTVIETERLYIDEVTEEEIQEVIEIESHKENRDYLWIGTVEEHKAEIADLNHMLLIFHEKESGETKGYGKESMLALIRCAFEETETNRLWLDVYPDNEIGIKLYESLGMHCDGVLRQNYLAERGYLDQIIYSLLRCEYETFRHM